MAPRETKSTDPADYSRRLITTLGKKAADAFPEFEAVMGWPLPPGVLPLARSFAESDTPPIDGWYYLDDKHGKGAEAPCPPWKVLRKLAKDGDSALEHFLFEHRAYGLLLGLLGFAEDPGGDVGFVDVGPDAVRGELYVHNHEGGLLESMDSTLAGFVQEHYVSWTDDVDEEEVEVDAEDVEALGAPPKPDAARVKDFLRQAKRVQWAVDVLRGEFDDWPTRDAEPTFSGPLRLHYELVAGTLTGDEARQRQALASARDAKGLLTRALAARVEKNLASPKSARLGWLKGPKLAEARALYGGGK